MHAHSTRQKPSAAPPPIPGWGTGTGYANTTITKAPQWHGGIACDALLNGLATGLFLVAAVSELALPAVFTHVAKIAYPIALVLLLVDLALLVLDLGDPFRFHHMLRVVKPLSPMSVGTWCLTIFSMPLTIVSALCVLSAFGIDFESSRKIAVILALLPGFGSAAYKGVLLSTNSQPGWKDARWLGGYLTNSAFLLGCAELLVLSVVMEQTQAVGILRTAFIALLVVNIVPLALLYANLHATFARLFTGEQRLRVGFFTVAAGTLIPLILMLVGEGLFFVFGAVVFLLLGSLVVRYVYVMIPHTVPLDARIETLK
jgi:hypothetical protein